MAACALKGLEVVLYTRAWLTVLRAAHPEQVLTFRQAFGVAQGSIGIATVLPPQVGGVLIIALYRAAFPALGMAALLAARLVQGIAIANIMFSLIMFVGAASIGAGSAPGVFDQVLGLFDARPALAVALTVMIGALAVLIVRRGRARLVEFGRHVAMGGAILRTPGRYALLVVVPTLLAFACRWTVTGILLVAFDVPVSLETLVRVAFSQGLSRSVQVAPGGIGTTQAFDLVALEGLASPEVITAYSLAQAAILLAFNVLFALAAFIWAFGWARTTALFRHPAIGVGFYSSQSPYHP